MRHCWVMPLLAIAVLSQTSTPELVLARRLEQYAQFLQRMWRSDASLTKLQISKWLATKGGSSGRN